MSNDVTDQAAADAAFATRIADVFSPLRTDESFVRQPVTRAELALLGSTLGAALSAQMVLVTALANGDREAARYGLSEANEALLAVAGEVRRLVEGAQGTAHE